MSTPAVSSDDSSSTVFNDGTTYSNDGGGFSYGSGPVSPSSGSEPQVVTGVS